MARLLRPSIPVEIKCRVALRQLGEAWPDDVILANRFVPRVVPSRSLGKLLDRLLGQLATLLNCPREQLHLDHDPALENRMKVFRDGAHIDYVPAANDPEWLFYRPYGAEFAGSHKVKTFIRGDHGQYSDAALARKNKRIAKKRAVNLAQNGKRGGALGTGRGKLRSANRWPPKGSRKIQNRRKR